MLVYILLYISIHFSLHGCSACISVFVHFLFVPLPLRHSHVSCSLWLCYFCYFIGFPSRSLSSVWMSVSVFLFGMFRAYEWMCMHVYMCVWYVCTWVNVYNDSCCCFHLPPRCRFTQINTIHNMSWLTYIALTGRHFCTDQITQNPGNSLRYFPSVSTRHSVFPTQESPKATRSCIFNVKNVFNFFGKTQLLTIDSTIKSIQFGCVLRSKLNLIRCFFLLLLLFVLFVVAVDQRHWDSSKLIQRQNVCTHDDVQPIAKEWAREKTTSAFAIASGPSVQRQFNRSMAQHICKCVSNLASIKTLFVN